MGIRARTTQLAAVTAYVGSSLPGLVPAGCKPEYGALTIVAQAGRTYWFQVATPGEAAFLLTVSTTDGRTATTTRLVEVRTHDVAVARGSPTSTWPPSRSRCGGRTTRFSFTYQVTSEDRAAGMLTFRATADPDPSRDAYLPDNEGLSAPVTIR